MTRWLETDTLSNQNIATALAVGAYTADADRLILCQIFADQVAGGDAYSFYLTIQIGGAGSAYQMVPVTDTAEPTAGVTAIGAQSVLLFVRSGDVVTAYIDGLAGDTTTPDTIVRWAELAALRPTTADRTLDVAATGEAGLDFDNIKAATGATTLTNITVPTVTAVTGLTVANLDAKISDVKAKTDLIPASPAAVGSAMTLADDAITSAKFDQLTAFPLESADTGLTAVARTGADSDTLETLSDQIDGLPTDQDVRDAMKLAPTAGSPAAGSVDTHLDDILADTSAIGGAGAVSWSVTVTDGSGNPLDGAEVWFTTDAGGSNVAASGSTNALGVVTFLLDAGTYYGWVQLAGYNFSNPTTIAVRGEQWDRLR